MYYLPPESSGDEGTFFAKRVSRERRIPLEVSAEIPNAETVAAFGEVRQMRADRNIGKAYNDVDAMMEELLADV